MSIDISKHEGLAKAMNESWNILAIPQSELDKLDKDKEYKVTGYWNGSTFRWEFKEIEK